MCGQALPGTTRATETSVGYPVNRATDPPEAKGGGSTAHCAARTPGGRVGSTVVDLDQ